MFYAILFVHWFADFVCQTRQMASNKSSSILWLSFHVGVYTLIMGVFGIRFALINGLAHLITDGLSSQASGFFWKKGDVHKFFCVIGLDQFAHVAVLYWTYNYFMI